jgi:hypothetical protein
VNNIVIIQKEGKGGELSFVLDTGVTKSILFNLAEVDSVEVNKVETRYIKGLGGGEAIKALLSRGNLLKIGDVTKVNHEIYVVYDSFLNFTPRLGIPVHGIIGYDLFKDFVVELNYAGKYLRLHEHDHFNHSRLRNWSTLPINISNKKPFLEADLEINDELRLVKLLIDTGGSDALWLFESRDSLLQAREHQYFEDFLGYGLSGSVYGKRSKVQRLSISGFEQTEVNVAFPDSVYLSQRNMLKERHGSIAGNLLKRFNYYFNYRDELIYLKPNKLFDEPYFYNNSGLIVEQRGTRLVLELQKMATGDLYNRRNADRQQISNSTTYRYTLKPAFEIVDIRKTSNAYAAGLAKGDIILAINNTAAHSISLQELNRYFYDEPGKRIRLKVEREEAELEFTFELDNVFQKKDPQITEGL